MLLNFQNMIVISFLYLILPNSFCCRLSRHSNVLLLEKNKNVHLAEEKRIDENSMAQIMLVRSLYVDYLKIGINIVMYDFKNDESWVIDQDFFYPFPNKAHYKINGVDLDFMDGILGLALGPIIKNDRKLYFHAFASIRESWVDTNTLMFQNGLIDGSGTFFLSSEVSETQSSVRVITDNGVLTYAQMDYSLGCWHAQDPFTTIYIHTIYMVIIVNDGQTPAGSMT